MKPRECGLQPHEAFFFSLKSGVEELGGSILLMEPIKNFIHFGKKKKKKKRGEGLM